MENLQFKSVRLSDVELKTEDGNVFTGYASVFGGNDSYNDTIVKGAYANVLKESTPKMFFNHDVSSIPIGKWLDLHEDEKGLFVKGELTPHNPQSEAVKAALNHGTVDGLSIGFALKKSDYDSKADGGRIIKNFSKLYEISVVTFPADKAARVESKAEDIAAINTIRDFENFLRDSGGFSKSDALALVAKAKELCSAQRDSEEKEKTLTEVLNRINRLKDSI
jgi:hypothetical protein